MKKLSALAVAALAATMLHATEYFVDCNKPDDEGNGLSEATAKRTIQAAVDAAASGDTVTVLPGTYAEGGKMDEWGSSNRVYVAGKALHITAADPDPAKTKIVGVIDETSADKCGPASVRCVFFNRTGLTEQSILTGFTICDGSTSKASEPTKDNPTTACGGVLCYPYSGATPVVVGCVFRNCYAPRINAMRGGIAVRCLFTGISPCQRVGISGDMTAVNCLYKGNVDSAGTLAYMLENSTLVNCTVSGNQSFTYLAQTGAKFYNTVALSASTLTWSGGSVETYSSVFGYQNYIDTSHLLWKDDNSVTNKTESDVFFAPGFGDLDLLAGGCAAGRGKGEYLDAWQVQMPKDKDGNYLVDLYVDYNGKPFEKDGDGRINAGCVQTVRTSAAGVLKFTIAGATAAERACASLRVDGRPFASGGILRDETFPAQHYVEVEGDGVYVAYWNGLYSGNIPRVPQLDGKLWVIAPSNADTVVTHTVTVTANALWVDPTNGQDVATAGTQAAPFKTPLYAASKAPNPCVIFCAQGEYAAGEYYGASVTNRLYDYSKRLRFVGAGAGKSILRGALDTSGSDVDGFGPAAVRPAYFANNSVLQGFTVCDGRVAKSGTSDKTDLVKGGAGYGVHFVDCTITNTAAGRGQIAYGGSVTRCRIFGYGAASTFAGRVTEGSSVVFSSLIGRGTGEGSTPSQGDSIFGSTVYKGGANTNYRQTLITSGSVYRNCLSHDSGSYSTGWAATVYGCAWLWSTTPTAKQVLLEHTAEDPKFVDFANYDCRLRADTGVLGKGYMPEDYYKQYCSDIDGRPVIFKDGKPTAGCVQQVVTIFSMPSSDPYATLLPGGDVPLEPGESVTVTVSDAKRPVVGFRVDGQLVEGTSYTYTAPVDGEPKMVALSEVVYGTNWYANASAVDDSGDGFTPETAKKTLISLCTNQYVLAGDVIHAAEGDYKEGAACYANTQVLRSRAIVKAGVTLVGAGQYVTFITGAPAEGKAGGSVEDGCGTTAIRCVTSYGGGVLKGFTLRDGYASGANGALVEDDHAGGYMGLAPTARICDCTITNCFSKRSAMAHGGRYDRCSLMGDTAAVQVGFDNNMNVFGGFYNCRILTSSSWTITCPFVNCILRNTHRAGGAGYLQIYCSKDNLKKITNCVFACQIRNLSTAEDFFPAISNNIVCTGFAGETPTAECQAWFKVLTQKQIEEAYDYATLAFKGTKSEYFCDAGVNVAGQENQTDITGGQRIYNATVDLGPAEYDWRGDYAAALDAEAVTSASPEVKLTDEGKVRLPDGAALCFKSSAQYNKLPFEIEDGTLTVGDSAYDETGVCKFRSPATLALSFAGEDGYADLGKLLKKRGVIVVVQ